MIKTLRKIINWMFLIPILVIIVVVIRFFSNGKTKEKKIEVKNPNEKHDKDLADRIDATIERLRS